MTPLSLGIFASANQGAAATSFESIATTTVGAGGTSTITFSSIPSTYTHLQLRVLGRSTRSAGVDILSMQMNSDTGSNYADHVLYGDGSTVQTDLNINYATINIQRLASSFLSSNIFSGFVIDILDYKNTNKNKTVRYLSGYDANGSGRVLFGSGLWRSTSAITSLSLFSPYSENFVQYSTFALYGIKEAS